MDRGESSDDVTIVEHLPKNETTKLTMDRGVNRCSVFSIIGHVTLIKLL